MMARRSAPLVVLAAIALAACGGPPTQSSHSGLAEQPSTQPTILGGPSGEPGTQPAILTVKQVEAETGGHPAVLLFTAQGCASCAGEARALRKATADRLDVRLVGVDLDGSDTPAALTAYIRAIGLESSTFVWVIDDDSTLARRYGITSLSSTVFLDSSGQARFVNQGPWDASTYSDQLRRIQ